MSLNSATPVPSTPTWSVLDTTRSVLQTQVANFLKAPNLTNQTKVDDAMRVYQSAWIISHAE